VLGGQEDGVWQELWRRGNGRRITMTQNSKTTNFGGSKGDTHRGRSESGGGKMVDNTGNTGKSSGVRVLGAGE
jgi:hypothetical protein